LVFSAELGDPLGVLDVILVEDAVKLNNVPVHIEAELHGVVHHQRKRYHVDPEVYKQCFEAKSAR
jgi:hypothetical protein